MTEWLKVLSGLRSSLNSVRDAKELDAQNAYYGEIKGRIARLRELAEGQAGKAYVREKISDFERSFTALAALHDGNQHSRSQQVA